MDDPNEYRSNNSSSCERWSTWNGIFNTIVNQRKFQILPIGGFSELAQSFIAISVCLPLSAEGFAVRPSYQKVLQSSLSPSCSRLPDDCQWKGALKGQQCSMVPGNNCMRFSQLGKIPLMGDSTRLHHKFSIPPPPNNIFFFAAIAIANG